MTAVALQRSFDELGAPLCEVDFCVLDLETTGGSPQACEVTEIGAIRFRGGEETGTFHTLVNPGAAIPPFITVLTGITQAMVVEAPTIAEALPSFLEFLGSAVVVGHNVRFDLAFLNAASERLGYGRLPNRSIDTLALARRLLRSEVRNLKLATLAGYLRATVEPNHRAFQDARATADVFWALLERAGTLGVTHLEDLLQLPRARGSPEYSKIRLTDRLPRAPGVYLLRDRGGVVFYIGKARNLRTRVRSYFYGDGRRTVADMLRELQAIDHRRCATELEAEVTELRLIAKHNPRYNRRSKPARSPHWVKLTDETYPRLSMVRSYRDDGCLYLGPFRSRRAAQEVVTGLWDALPLRRCRGKAGRRNGACAFAQLGVASCPCDGNLSEDQYHEIVDRFVEGIERDPAILLGALADKVSTYAGLQRYEEAGWCRDRYEAVARAVRRRRAWQALQAAGLVRLTWDPNEGALIDRGRLTASWSGRPPRSPPATAASPDEFLPQVPPSVKVAEEANLIWSWMQRPDVRLAEPAGPIALPGRPVPDLVDLVRID